MQTIIEKMRKLGFDCIRCLLDCLVAIYYLKTNVNLAANKIGILGVITSLMAIAQSLGFI